MRPKANNVARTHPIRSDGFLEHFESDQQPRCDLNKTPRRVGTNPPIKKKKKKEKLPGQHPNTCAYNDPGRGKKTPHYSPAA